MQLSEMHGTLMVKKPKKKIGKLRCYAFRNESVEKWMGLNF